MMLPYPHEVGVQMMSSEQSEVNIPPSMAIPVENGELVTVRDAMRTLNVIVARLQPATDTDIQPRKAVLMKHNQMVAVVLSADEYRRLLADRWVEPNPDSIPVPADSFSEKVRREVPSTEDLCETAWTIIANAHGGRWEDASSEWREAAERWRDDARASLAKGAAQEKAVGIPVPAEDREP